MNRDKVLELAMKVWGAAGGTVYIGPGMNQVSEFADLIEREVRGDAEPVAWIYTLEYGNTVANIKVSLDQLNYPFGVCGADYLRENSDGMSYVRQTRLYTHPQPAVVRQLVDALQGMFNIAIDSQGVAGYHLNGEIAEWDDFEEIDKVKAALAAAKDSGL